MYLHKGRMQTELCMLRCIVYRCEALYWEEMSHMIHNHTMRAVSEGVPSEATPFLERGDKYIEACMGEFHRVCERSRDQKFREAVAAAFPSGKVPHYAAQDMQLTSNIPPDLIDTPPRRRTFINENQFTLGGESACTSIAFVVAAAMREKYTSKEVVNDVRWPFAMNTGVRLWKIWMETTPERTASTQTLEQIRAMPLMNDVFKTLGDVAAEFGGRIDGAIPAHISEDKDQVQTYRDTFPGLIEALSAMAEMGLGTVAIVTIGSTSISLWTAGVFSAGNASPCEDHTQFVVFDSHGRNAPPGNSTIEECRDVFHAYSTILDLCCFSDDADRRRYYTIGSQDATDMYCMYVFRPKK